MTFSRPARPRELAVAALATVALLVPAAIAGTQPAGRRIVAIGDVHGAHEAFVEILRASGIIDDRDRWSGGQAVFVQTGDIFDRGSRVRDSLDLLMRLEGEAKRAGGRVEALLGNHEVMNLLHDVRDVSPAAFATFADNRSEDRRKRAFEDYSSILARRKAAAPDRDAWMQARPPGFVEYAEALEPRGRYGRWLRDHKVVLKEGDTIFNHAGIGPETPGTVDDVNKAVARDIAQWDGAREQLMRAGVIRSFFTLQETLDAAGAEIEKISAAIADKRPVDDYVTREYVDALQWLAQIGKSSLLAPEGPLWFRGYARWEDAEAPQVGALLSRLGAARVVCGHTPIVPGGITLRYGGRVILIDTGMLSVFFKGGRASALELQGEQVSAIYKDGRQVLAETVPR